MMEIRGPIPEKDIAPLTEAVNMPGVRRGTMRLPFTGPGLMRQRLTQPPADVHLLVATWEDVAVGHGSLRLGKGRRRHAGDVHLFVHDAYWGRGIGRALLSALLDLADNWYGLSRVGLEVSPGNSRALSLYEMQGFCIEGRKRGDVMLDGQLEDTVVLGRVRPAPGVQSPPAKGSSL